MDLADQVPAAVPLSPGAPRLAATTIPATSGEPAGPFEPRPPGAIAGQQGTASSRRSTVRKTAVQNIPFELAEASGISWMTSQCSTTLSSSKRKKSANASPGLPGMSVRWECVTTILP